MKILAIETSCDETGITILEAKGTIKNPNFKILANSLASQVNIHREYGGVYPMMAKREHIKNLPILFKRTLQKAKLEKSKKPFDVITVTSGPGLEPALWTGIVFAKELAKEWNVPLVPVNHMEGHILSVFGKDKGEFKIPKIDFPALSLLISGGHTELVLVKDWMNYKVIGETLDDAAGEAFDKVARMLGLPYPGGPEISKLAEIERKNKTENPFNLPRPMLYSKNFDFSFSGLKTAVLYLIKKIESLNQEIKNKIAMEFEDAVTETLIYKTKKVIVKYKIRTLIVAGGVASNKHLRKEIKKSVDKSITIFFPEKGLSTDNSIMIGIVGYMRYLKKKGRFGNGSKIKADGGLRL